MNQYVRPPTQSALVPDPNARKDAPDEESEEGKPGIDENAAGFLKDTDDRSSEK